VSLNSTSHTYETFDLLVGSKTADGYAVTITRAPAGDASGFCQLDPDNPELRAALLRLEEANSD